MKNNIWKSVETLANQDLSLSQSFNLMDFFINIYSGDNDLIKKIYREYGYYFKANMDNKEHTVINIKIIRKRIPEHIKYQLEKNEEIIMHSSTGNSFHYWQGGKQFDRKNQHRSGKIKRKDNGTFIVLSKLTDNIIYYPGQDNTFYIMGIGDYYFEIRDIIESELISYYEKKGYLMVHSSCCEKDGEGILIVSGSGKGKTTLLLHLVFNLNYNFVASDRTIIQPKDKELHVFGMPAQMAIGLGSIKSYPMLNAYIPKNIRPYYNTVDENKYKIRFELDEFEDLCKGAIRKECKVSKIYFPTLNFKNRTFSRELHYKKGIEKIKNELLSPLDPSHPKWTRGLEDHSTEIAKNVENLFLYLKNSKVCFCEIQIGNDFKQELHNI